MGLNWMNRELNTTKENKIKMRKQDGTQGLCFGFFTLNATAKKLSPDLKTSFALENVIVTSLFCHWIH